MKDKLRSPETFRLNDLEYEEFEKARKKVNETKTVFIKASLKGREDIINKTID